MEKQLPAVRGGGGALRLLGAGGLISLGNGGSQSARFILLETCEDK